MPHLQLLFIVYLISFATATAQANFDPVTYSGQDRTWAFHDAAGTADTTAILKDDPSITAWATGYANLHFGSNVAAQWQTPAEALGPAEGTSFDIVSLGRGGQITLTFSNPITNGTGFDFAIFENSFSDGFLELAWVEVSTDGVHFVRFPNFSYTDAAVGGFGTIDPTNVHGLAGKYRQGYGTPFDLQQLQYAYDAAIADTASFDASYESDLEANFMHIDLNNINHVRIIDIVGDGSAHDCEGEVIFDPYPTSGSAGFDLDALAVINEASPSGTVQTIDFPEIGHQRLSDGSLPLSASASSGLPVSFEVVEGPATLSGSVLNFTGIGQALVRASQAGDATFAPAPAVLRSFQIADELQHIYVEPIANQLTGATDVALHIRSSSGLPVRLFVDKGPMTATVDELSHLFSSGPEAGSVTLRAVQAGGESDGVTYAPAEEVYTVFDILAPGDPAAPLNYAAWQAGNSSSASADGDSDGDGASNLEEYVAGTDPNQPGDRPAYPFELREDEIVFDLIVSRRAVFRLRAFQNTDLSDASGWGEVIPEIISDVPSGSAEDSKRALRLTLPKQTEQSFWRFQMELD